MEEGGGVKEEVEEGKLNGKMVMINNSGIRKSGREKKMATDSIESTLD